MNDLEKIVSCDRRHVSESKVSWFGCIGSTNCFANGLQILFVLTIFGRYHFFLFFSAVAQQFSTTYLYFFEIFWSLKSLILALSLSSFKLFWKIIFSVKAKTSKIKRYFIHEIFTLFLLTFIVSFLTFVFRL